MPVLCVVLMSSISIVWLGMKNCDRAIQGAIRVCFSWVQVTYALESPLAEGEGGVRRGGLLACTGRRPRFCVSS